MSEDFDFNLKKDVDEKKCNFCWLVLCKLTKKNKKITSLNLGIAKLDRRCWCSN